MNSLRRLALKEVYRLRMYEDREVGKQIAELTRQLNNPPDFEDKKELHQFRVNLRSAIEQLRNSRFRANFPSFAKFKNFVIENKVPMDELV